MSVKEANGPCYISSHSADVILSDIRPIKLKIEALRCINVLLDEFLYSVISTASSLTTDRLRAGLLGVLPTALGKEALLEAEVELRAYWDRNKHAKATYGDDKDTFNLAWAFELMRMKCEAYSTLNDSDEDSSSEAKLNAKLRLTGSQPPMPALVAPAALYLTAIIEAMCEHILSNVGRVASRDSSRTYAVVQDLFVALCEDETIYPLFKDMKVYSQIEELSKAPKTRRSKSISSRGDNKLSVSRTSSPHPDLSSNNHSPTPPPSRVSSDLPMAPVSNTPSRSSMDKARGMKKLLTGNRTSSDENSRDGHKRSESILSLETKQAWAAFQEENVEDQDFDDFMRSGSTMKVSLTPDRLKSMETYKQEKVRRPSAPPSSQPEAETASFSLPPSTRVNGHRPTLRGVDSIVEVDDEESAAKSATASIASSHRPRQSSVVTPVTVLPISTRTRSVSTTSAPSKPNFRLQRKGSKTNIEATSPPPSSFQPSTPSTMHMPGRRPAGMPKGFDAGFDASPLPQKTRRVQRNRESMDLDDIMGGSGDEDDAAAPESAVTQSLSSSKMHSPTKPASTGVSSSTRDLMDFLNDGPPMDGPKVSKAGRELMDFLADGPPDMGGGYAPSETGVKVGKGSGRLQRMISKLSLGGQEKGRSDGAMSPRAQGSSGRTLNNKSSTSNLIPMPIAPRPIPPRYPPANISPPSSPSSEDVTPVATRPRQPSVNRRAVPVWEQSSPTLPKSPAQSLPVTLTSSIPTNLEAHVNGHGRAPGATQEQSNAVVPEAPKKTPKTVPAAIRISQKASPSSGEKSTQITSTSLDFVKESQELRRLFNNASTAEECRILLDIFLSKSGVAMEASEHVPYPSPSPSDHPDISPTISDVAMEHALVELLLGGDASAFDEVPRRRRKVVIRKASRMDTSPVVDVGPHSDVVSVPPGIAQEIHTSPVVVRA